MKGQMRKYITILLTLSLIFVKTEYSFGQKMKLDVAQKFYDEFDFKSALEVYKDILSTEKHAADTTALALAGDCNMKLGNFAEAEALFQKLAVVQAKNTDNLHALANAQKIQGKYYDAVQTYKSILTINPNDAVAKEYSKMPDFENKLKRDSTIYKISNSKINSEASDFAPGFFTNGKLIFASSRGQGAGSSRSYIWNNQPYLNNYICTINADSSLSNESVLGNDINSRYHEGTMTYHPGTNTIYFTRNNVLNGNVSKSKDGHLYLGIYIAKATTDGNVSEMEAFEYNDKNFSVQHPTLNTAGDRIYFSSNRPGGKGGMDIWYCDKKDEKWQEPKNLNAVNSSGDDVFPFISNDSTLYFSSNGHLGLGGLDMFSAVLKGDTNVVNLGYPANTRYDDFSAILFNNESVGYFCSNRPGGKGDDDIYYFQIAPPDSINIKGQVVDIATMLPIKNALVTITNSDGSVVQALTDNDGNYTMMAPYKKVVNLSAEKKDYDNSSVELATNPRSTEYTAPVIQMKKIDFFAFGTVVYDLDGSPASGALVKIKDPNGAVLDSLRTAEDGTYKITLEEGKNYTLEVSKKDYVLLAKEITTIGASVKGIHNDFRLYKLEKGTVVRLDNIYYDYGKSDIRPDAAQELNKLVRILKDNPTMKIELSSHSDSRGGDSYNLKLSDARAKSAVKYIISQGIDADRLIGKGYGETMILNRCTNGVDCSEEEHQFNRRTEFKILEI